MGNAGLLKMVLFIWLHFLMGYESANGEAILGLSESGFTAKSQPEELLDAFLAGEIPVFYGDGNIVDEFQFSAEYWGSPDDRYDENSDFTYRDKKISMEEYEALGKEIFGW